MLSLSFVVCLTVLAVSGESPPQIPEPQEFQWDYNFTTRRSSFNCPRGQYVKRMKSEYDPVSGDRRYAFICGGDDATHQCGQSGWENKPRQGINYVCPKNGVMTGLQTQYDRNKKDRFYNIKCCQFKSRELFGCFTSNYFFNYPKGGLNINMGTGAIKGIGSPYIEDKDDRVFKFYMCNVS